MKPEFYVRRKLMPFYSKLLFTMGYDSADIAIITGYKESSVERWLHV